MFEKLKSMIVALLGVSQLPTKEGKVDFSEEQKNLINSEFASMGADFLAKFEAAANAQLENKEGIAAAKAANELAESIKTESAKEIGEMQVKLSAATREILELSKKVETLSHAPEEEVHTEEVVGKDGAKTIRFKPNMNLKHNKMALDFMLGKEIGATTIDVADMKTEFGSYLSQFGITLEVLRKLTQKTETEQYMTTKLAIESWKASTALITSVVQQFTSKWTPLGTSTFTPIAIQNRRHKINVPITPDEVSDSWLGYLYDESLTPDAMPITKYIIEQLVLPKVAEDRELRLIGKGVYASAGSPSTGDPGQATGKSMDGFCTILKKEKASGTSAINFNELGTITDANIIDKMNEFVDGIDEVYQGIPMNIFCSLDRYKQYKRAYQKLYPTTKGVDKSEDMIDFSLNRLVPLPSMSGEDLFFATPKENFVRLMHKNNGASKIHMQTVDYDVKVFAEWWEGVGFAIAEAVFAYVPDADSGSGS